MIAFKKCAAAIVLAMAATSALADELRFDRMFVIGDSLSDGGTYSLAVQAGAGGLVPAIQYRFTTNAPDGSSQTYAEALATSLGIDLQPNIINGVPAGIGTPFENDVPVGGTNFAEGGSRVSDPAGIGNNPLGGITTVPLRTQVDRLLATNPGFNQNDIVIVWGGANDVFAQSGAVGGALITPATAAANMVQAGNELVADVERLAAAGAQTILVVTVPDIGSTPFGLQSETAQPGSAALLSGLTDAFNQTVVAQLAGGSAVLVDSQQILGAIQADPARYGFTAPNAATVPACAGSSLNCLQGLNASADSEQRVFADGVHPTTSAHALFGQAALAGLRAATQTGVIPVATLTALRQQALSLENRLNPTVLISFDESGNRSRREVGDIDVFASIEAGRYALDSQQVTPGLTGSTQVAKLGFDVAVLPNATVGAGISLDHGQVSFDNDAGGFDTRLGIGVLFGQMALSETFYVNAAGGGGLIDVYNIDRRFALGPAIESYNADSSGTFLFGRIGGGMMLPVSDEILLNPFAHFTREEVKIDGFTESTGAASLSFGKTEYVSNRLTGGLSVTYSPVSLPSVKLNLRGSAEYDMKDDDLIVELGPNASALSGVAAPRPDQLWGYVAATALVAIDDDAFLSVSGSSSLGLNGANGFVAAIAVKIPF